MTIKGEIQIEEYKRTFAEAYKQGFIDAMSVCKTEPQYDFGDFADRLWKIAYERGKREALEQTEPTISKMEQVEDEPKTESIVGNSDTENAKYTSDCPWK